jgi:A/G-specific adenine glycosylase
MSLASSPRRRSRKREPGAGLENDGDCGRSDPSRLLAWYDRHRRRLPWRALPGEAADPYRVWLSEVMLQQTTVTAVAPYYAKFLARFPSVEALAAAEIDEVFKLWAGLGYYARARHLHACAKAVVERHGGAFPVTEAELAGLPGIGPYTAAAVAAIAFDGPASPVDGNVERVITRLYAVEDELPGAKPAIRALAERLRPPRRPGDFAQAMMDLGATICTPKSPACALCPFLDGCAARRRGDPETFPRKAKKREGKLRRGAAFVALRADGHLLVRTRPARGLLGGMTEVPTTEFVADFDEGAALDAAPRLGAGRGARAARWRRLPGVVTHMFTHFPLELVVFRAEVPAAAAAPDGMRWIAASEVRGAAFPSLMRKVLAHARVE